MNAGIKLKGSAGIESSAGFYYVSGVESISEYEEINDKDLQKLLWAIAELAIYDLVIVDQASGFTEKTKVILKEADIILAEPQATVGFAGLRVIEQTTKKSLPNGFQKSEFVLEHGFIDGIVSRGSQRKQLAELLSMHSGA